MGEAKNCEGCMSIGPIGGQGGDPWTYQPKDCAISQIIVSHGIVVDSLLFQSRNSQGQVESSQMFGGRGGATSKRVGIRQKFRSLWSTLEQQCSPSLQHSMVQINSPAEYLEGIQVTVGSYSGHTVITSLSFDTNVAKYGPFGTKRGTYLSFPIEGGVIIGFHGRAGMYLDAIGIYAKPKSSATSLSEEYTEIQLQDINTAKQVVPRDPGPWGGAGGKQWDDGVFSEVKKIRMYIASSVNHVIKAIEFQYKTKDGNFVWSPRHGCRSPGGDIIKRIEVDSTSEVFVGIEGYYWPVEGTNGLEAITSVSFYTNKGKYGPYGEEIGKSFTSTLSGGKVVGFFGRSGHYLNAIGVHLDYN